MHRSNSHNSLIYVHFIWVVLIWQWEKPCLWPQWGFFGCLSKAVDLLPFSPPKASKTWPVLVSARRHRPRLAVLRSALAKRQVRGWHGIPSPNQLPKWWREIRTISYLFPAWGEQGQAQDILLCGSTALADMSTISMASPYLMAPLRSGPFTPWGPCIFTNYSSGQRTWFTDRLTVCVLLTLWHLQTAVALALWVRTAGEWPSLSCAGISQEKWAGSKAKVLPIPTACVYFHQMNLHCFGEKELSVKGCK